MTSPVFNPQPNYSGVTIQITNPAVNVGQPSVNNIPCINSGLCSSNAGNGYPNAYPAQYYLNNYNYPPSVIDNKANTEKVIYAGEDTNEHQKQAKEIENIQQPDNKSNSDSISLYKIYAEQNEQKDNDMTKSENIKKDLSERESELAEEKKNTKEEKIVALTDEYIKSLENYLNNPNDEIRLMASKDILTRLDEDKDRYDDAALNALLNKMIQDPNKLVRISALSALSSQLASGNDYTVKLLQNIQSNPNSDKEDVLQAADILLKMSAGVDVKKIPNPSVKEKKEQ